MLSKKWVISTCIALVLFFLASQIFLQSRFFSKKVKQSVETYLREVLGQKVVIDRVAIRLFSTSLVLKDLSIETDSLDFPSSLLAKEVLISFSPSSFFTESLFIRKIKIDSPVMHLTAPALGDKPLDGVSNIDGGKGAPPSVVIRSIQIKEGTLTFKGGKIIKEVSLSGIDGDIRPNLEMSHFEIDLVGEGGLYSIEGMEGEIKKLEGKMIIQPEKVVLKKGHLLSSHAAVFAEGDIFFRDEDPFDLNINLQLPLERIDLLHFAGDKVSFLKEKKVSGELGFHGRLSGSYPGFSLKGEAALPNLFINEEEIGSIKGDLSYSDGRVSISSFSGSIFSGSISGDIETDIASSALSSGNDRSRRIAVNLQYEQLPLYQFANIISKGDQRENELLRGILISGDLTLSGEEMRIETLQAQGQLQAERRALFSPPVPTEASRLIHLSALFQKGGVLWKWSENRLTLEEGKLFFPDTALRFRGKWHPIEGLVLKTTLISDEMAEINNALRIPLKGKSKIEGVITQKKGGPSFKGKILIESAQLKTIPVKKFVSKVTFQGNRIGFENGFLEGYAKSLNKKRKILSSKYQFVGNLNLKDTKSPRFNFRVKVQSGNLQEIFRFFRLSIPLYTHATGRLDIQGEPKAFSVKGPLTFSRGSLYGEDFDHGRVNLTVTRKEVILRKALLVKGESRLAGEGAIRYNKTYWLALKGRKLRIQETGFLKSRFPGLSGDVALIVSGKGSIKKPQLSFDTTVGSLRYGEMERIDGTIKADWENRFVRFAGEVADRDILISGEVELVPEFPFTFQSRFNRLQIEPLLKKHLSGPVEDIKLLATGELSGSGRLTRLERVNLSGVFTELKAAFGNYQIENDGALAIQAKQGTFTFNKTRFKGENTALVFDGNLTLLKQWNLFLNGEADLNLITFFTKEITSGNGKAVLDLAITDRWQEPKIRGQLSLKDGKIRTATLSQNIQIASLAILFNERQLILETFEGNLGSGRFQTTGKAVLAGFQIDSFGLFLSLDKARINLAQDLPATVDGELFFQKKKGRQTLKGDLKLKKMVYEKKVDLALIVRELQRKQRDIKTETPLIGRTEINIHLSGDEGIQIVNNLGEIPLRIDLLIKGSFDDPLLIGRIDIPEGNIFYQKNTFRVNSGSVDFLNPNRIDPTFDLEARTDVQNDITKRSYRIDLGLSGTLSQITLTLRSFPSLPKDDILALLTIGKTAADLDEVKGGAGIEAANIAVTQFMSKSVEQVTGIVGDPVEKITGIRTQVEPYLNGDQSRSSTGTRLTAEKRLLDERLLVVYSTTLDPSEEDLIRMVYEINKNISLVGNREDNGQIGGDILFRFEFR